MGHAHPASLSFSVHPGNLSNMRDGYVFLWRNGSEKDPSGNNRHMEKGVIRDTEKAGIMYKFIYSTIGLSDLHPIRN